MTVNETMSLYRHSTTIIVVYCFAYSVIFLLGLVGNCLVVAVMIRCPQMRTVTNLFIVNLAVADILVVLFCLPANLLSTIYVRKFNFQSVRFWCMLYFLHPYFTLRFSPTLLSSYS